MTEFGDCAAADLATEPVRRVGAAALEARIGEFAALLRDCVAAGASVNFVLPFSRAEAEKYWREKVSPPLRLGRRALWEARVDGRLAGSVQLDWDTPPNQPHRAEVAKLIVSPAFRRRGLARALMTTLEAEARALGRGLITLDTRSGDAAEPLYLSLGYRVVGSIPDYSVAPEGGRLDAATFLYKTL